MIICFFKGHNWSQWHNFQTKKGDYRYCSRCSATEERIGLMVVKKRNISHWLISLTKPSFRDSLEQAHREGQQQLFSRIPRDVLNEGIKCLANELSKKDFDSLGLFLMRCGYCRNRNFCGDIIHSMQKAYKKYELKEKAPKRGGKMRVAAGILMIIMGIIMLTQISWSAIEAYQELEEVVLVILFAWWGFVLTGGIFTLQKKFWGLCLAGSILSMVILPIIFVCLRKKEWTK